MRRHVLSHRYGEYQWSGFRIRVVRVERIVFVHGNLGVALSVQGIEVVTVSGTIHVAVNLTAIYINMCTCTFIIREVTILLNYVYIARYVVTAVYIAMDEDVLVAESVFR